MIWWCKDVSDDLPPIGHACFGTMTPMRARLLAFDSDLVRETLCGDLFQGSFQEVSYRGLAKRSLTRSLNVFYFLRDLLQRSCGIFFQRPCAKKINRDLLRILEWRSLLKTLCRDLVYRDLLQWSWQEMFCRKFVCEKPFIVQRSGGISHSDLAKETFHRPRILCRDLVQRSCHTIARG